MKLYTTLSIEYTKSIIAFGIFYSSKQLRNNDIHK